MSVLSIGLSETVREWFSSVAGSGGGGTAVETAPPVEVATKPKRPRVGVKKKADASAEDGDDGSAGVTLESGDAEGTAVAEPPPAPEAPEETTTFAPAAEVPPVAPEVAPASPAVMAPPP